MKKTSVSLARIVVVTRFRSCPGIAGTETAVRLFLRAQADGPDGQRHEQVRGGAGQLRGAGGEHAVAALRQDAPAGAAAAGAAGRGQAEGRVRDAQPEGHVRVVLSLLQAHTRAARLVRRVLRPVHPGQDARRSHLGPHPGILGPEGRAQRAVPQVRGHETGKEKRAKVCRDDEDEGVGGLGSAAQSAARTNEIIEKVCFFENRRYPISHRLHCV